MPDGPPVCLISGFPGVGKSSLARKLMAAVPEYGGKAVMVEMQDDLTQDDFLLDLAQELSANGLDALADAVTSGGDLNRALGAVLNEEVLIVIDEFQRTFQEDAATPIDAWVKFFGRLANRPNILGRLLLLSNRQIEEGRWSEPFMRRALPAPTPEEAESLLETLLQQHQVTDTVPLERRREIVNWLGCNPRALNLLAASLELESLDTLIGLCPEAWEARDRSVSPNLLRRLEIEILERSIARQPHPIQVFLRHFSVYRKAVEPCALELLAPGGVSVADLQRDLISRYVLEHRNGWYTLHPIAREIMLDRLRIKPTDFASAHSAASQYYTRHFTGARLLDSGKLGGYFIESRYHLTQARRTEDLQGIADRFLEHLKATTTGVTPVPRDARVRDERIVTLSAALSKPGPKTLHYHLARLLEARGQGDDMRGALVHARIALGPKAPHDAWLLCAKLADRVEGVKDAISLLQQGIKVVPASGNLFSLYQYCAELLARADRLDDAISLLQQGIKVPGMTSLSSLYQYCAELLARADRLDDAISLLQQGIGIIAVDQSAFVLYVVFGSILSRAGRYEEAIRILKEGMRMLPSGSIAGRPRVVELALYLCAAQRNFEALSAILTGTGPDAIDEQQKVLGEILAFQVAGQWEDAAKRAAEGREKYPTYLHLAVQEAFSHLCVGDALGAEEALNRFPNWRPLSTGNPTAWLRAFIALCAGQQKESRNHLETYLGRPLEDSEQSNREMLLRLWDIPAEPGNTLCPAYCFPMLPPSLTGLQAPVTRNSVFVPSVLDTLPPIASATTPKPSPAPAPTPTAVTEALHEEVDSQPLRLLHLSDLHFTPDTRVVIKTQPLIDDLGKLGVRRLDYLVISGDITNWDNEVGYEKACEFVKELMERFSLHLEYCILVPGNHDMKDNGAYELWQTGMPEPKDEECVAEGKIRLVRHPERYPRRVLPFAENFFQPLTDKEYPLDYTAQGLVFTFSEARVQFLTLNSCWQIDKYNTKRSSIHIEALMQAIGEANRQRDAHGINGDGMLRIAVWHHAVRGSEQMKDITFLDHLRTNGVQLCLHGDTHEIQRDRTPYWQEHGMEIIGAGSFASPATGRPESTPCLYNLLEIKRDLSSIRVHTRRQVKIDGAWEGAFEWPDPDDSTKRIAYYDIDMQTACVLR
ncbi:MAG: AAA family ATPase [Armatimonadota bacterium]